MVSDRLCYIVYVTYSPSLLISLKLLNLAKSGKRFEKHKEKNAFAARGLTGRSMGHDHGNGDHGTGDPGTEFPIHPMRASGQCPETISGLGKCL